MKQFQVWAVRIGAYNATRKPLFEIKWRAGCWCGRRYMALCLGRYFVSFELPHLENAVLRRSGVGRAG